MDQQFQQVIDELINQSRVAEREDRKLAEEIQPMLNLPGWSRYTELLNRLIQGKADQMLQPAGSIDGAIALEHVKGAMNGLIMARDLPALIIQAMKAAVPATDGDEEC